MTDPIPDPPSQKAWAEAAIKAQVGSLDAVRSTAEKWAGTVTALLGVFGTVAVATGTTTLDKFPDSAQLWVVLATALAGIAAIISIVTAAQAAQGATVKLSNFTTSAFRAQVFKSTDAALGKLRVSQISGIAAAAIVFAGSMLGLIIAAAPDTEPEAKPKMLVIAVDGTMYCGEATISGGQVQIAGKTVKAANAEVVTSC